MEKELDVGVEYVQIAIPGEDYERKLYLLVGALLSLLEKEMPQDEDNKAREVA